MAHRAATAEGLIDHHAQLVQFLNWLTPVIFVFSLVYGITALIFGDLATGIGSGAIFGYGVVLLIARQSLAKRRTSQAVHLACLGFLAAALLIAVVQPALYPNLLIIPILVVAIALPYLRGTALWRLLVACWGFTVVIASIGIWFPTLDLIPEPNIPAWFTRLLLVNAIAASSAFGLFLLWQFHERLTRMLHQEQATHSALQHAYTEVEARAASQARLLAEIEQQHATIEALNVPLLPIAKGTWLLPLLGTLDHQRLSVIQSHALDVIHQQRARVLVVDLTGIGVLTPESAKRLIQLTQAVQLLGVEVIIVGIRSEVAQTMAQSAITVHGVRIYQDITAVLEQLYTANYSQI